MSSQTGLGPHIACHRREGNSVAFRVFFRRLKVTSVMCGGVVWKSKISVKMLAQIAESSLQKLHAGFRGVLLKHHRFDFGNQK